MPWAGLATRALTGLLVEDVGQWAGGSGRDIAHTLASVTVQVPVRATVVSLIPAPTNTLTGFHVQFLIWATHVCWEYVCRDGRRGRQVEFVI